MTVSVPRLVTPNSYNRRADRMAGDRVFVRKKIRDAMSCKKISWEREKRERREREGEREKKERGRERRER